MKFVSECEERFLRGVFKKCKKRLWVLKRGGRGIHKEMGSGKGEKDFFYE